MEKRIKTRPAKEAYDEEEAIESILFNPNAIHVTVIPLIDIDGVKVFDYSKQSKTTVIAGEALAELGKKPEKYTINDLWEIIDDIESGALTSVFDSQSQPLG